MTDRDDFNQPTKEMLARRVGYRCSNPHCRKPTSGPRTDPTKAVNIGVAAHITAASEGGPRYDPSLTSEQRREIDNGIWLCQNCAKLVDNDPGHYTVDLLRRWKAEAEEAARQEVESRYPPPLPTAAPYQPPRPLPEFVGRTDELQRLADLLQPGAQAAITGLVGMGGLGKTELAKIAVHRAADRFPDGVLWADCGHQDLPTIADLWAAAYGIQLPGDEADSADASVDAKTAAWRSLVSGKEALLIFDNVQPQQDVEPLFPPRGRSIVLITTRYTRHPALHSAVRLALKQFSPGEAADLAEWILGQEMARAQADDATHLFQLLGYLPLAIAVALHLAAKCGWGLAYLMGKLEAAGALAVLGDDESSLRASLNATFETAWANLPEDLQETFRTLALFNEGPTFSTLALADTLDLEEPDALAQLRRLAGRSLLLDAGEGRWALHPLLREFAVTRPPVDEATHARMARHYVSVADAASDLYLEGGDGVLQALALFDREWLHIRAGQAWAAAHAGEDEEAARLCSDYPTSGIHCLSLRLHPREQIRWLDAAARAARNLGDREAEGNHLGNLGLAYADLGDAPRAIEYYEQILAIHRELGNRRGEGADLGNLGLAYARLGETRKAIEYYEQALAIAQKIGDRRSQGNHLGNLGTAYADLGEARKAIKYHEQALAIAQEIGDRRGAGTQLGNLGNAYGHLGETRKAIEYHEQALAIAQGIGNRRGAGNHLGNLGTAYARLGETCKAIKYHERALAIAREIGDRRGEGANLGNLGIVYAHLGEMRKAIESYQQALTIALEIGDLRTEGAVRENLGTAYAELGEMRKAIEYYEQALAIAQEIGDRRGEGSGLGNLGLAYAGLGDLARARDFCTQALAIFEAIESPYAEQVRRSLAELES